MKKGEYCIEQPPLRVVQPFPHYRNCYEGCHYWQEVNGPEKSDSFYILVKKVSKKQSNQYAEWY